MGAKKNEGGDGHKKDENSTTVVLKLDLHCEGCVSKINKFLRGFKGVETVKCEIDTGKITLTGKVDPTKVRDKLHEKMKKKVEIISPQPKKEKEKEKENKDPKKTEEKKPKEKEPPVTTAVLKVSLHCQGCVDKIGKIVSKTKGVHEMSIDKEKETVSVKGTMDVKALVGNLAEKLKRKVEVVPPKKDKESEKEGSGGKKNKGGGDGDNKVEENGGGKLMEQNRMQYMAMAPPFGYEYGYTYGNVGGYNYGPIYTEHSHLHAPQLFSDENPNACSVM